MAWGANGVGQLGNGTTTASDVPVAVSGISEATAVAVGTWVHGGSPGRGLAVLKDGTVMAWGFNEGGELGDGTETNSDVPVAVCAAGEQAPCAQDLSGVTAITAGSGHTLALLSNGTVVAWGTNDRGLLGDGYLNVTPDGAIGWNVPVPVPVDGLSDATAISSWRRLQPCDWGAGRASERHEAGARIWAGRRRRDGHDQGLELRRRDGGQVWLENRGLHGRLRNRNHRRLPVRNRNDLRDDPRRGRNAPRHRLCDSTKPRGHQPRQHWR